MAPSMAFFRSFYALWSTAPGESSGCLSLRIADEMPAIHIPMAWGADERPITRVTKKVEEFRQKWLLVDIGSTNASRDVPEAPPMKHDGWSSVGLAIQAMSALVGRMKLLHDVGLTGQMVAQNFMQRHIVLLQTHMRPMWMYSGPQDKMRQYPEGLPEEQVALAMKVSSGLPTSLGQKGSS